MMFDQSDFTETGIVALVAELRHVRATPINNPQYSNHYFDRETELQYALHSALGGVGVYQVGADRVEVTVDRYGDLDVSIIEGEAGL